MLAFVYLALFLALSAALTCWRVSCWQRRHGLVRRAVRAAAVPAKRL